MSRFSAAADWLQHITGTSQPDVTDVDSSQQESMMRDAYSMSDLEARERARNDVTRTKKEPVVKGVPPMSGYQQPKPKFVAHKTPKTNAQKDKKGSNRLGDQLHYT